MEKNKVLIVDDISENIKTISEMIKDSDIDGKSILLALQAHNQKTDEYDGKKNQNQNKIISIFL